jgi:hypothetical protein
MIFDPPKKASSWLRTRWRMVVFGAVFFGGGLAATAGDRWLPRSIDLDLPAMFILAVAFLLVGACFGEFMWQVRSKNPDLSQAPNGERED